MDATGLRTRMKTVVIADDEPSMRLLVSATLARHDLNIVEAADGNQAWKFLRELRPELALLDVRMPGRSGVELTRDVRRDPVLCNIYIILLTANAQYSDVIAGLAAGANRYLTKPFSPLTLLEEVERGLGRP